MILVISQRRKNHFKEATCMVICQILGLVTYSSSRSVYGNNLHLILRNLTDFTSIDQFTYSHQHKNSCILLCQKRIPKRLLLQLKQTCPKGQSPKWVRDPKQVNIDAMPGPNQLGFILSQMHGFFHIKASPWLLNQPKRAKFACASSQFLLRTLWDLHP